MSSKKTDMDSSFTLNLSINLNSARGNASICRFSQCVCVSRNLLVNALVIINLCAFQCGFLFLSRFYCKCTRFCVDVSFLRENVWSFFVCLLQSKFNRFGCWLTLWLL